MPDTPSREWSKDEVLAQLRARAKKDQPVSAQVFLHENAPDDVRGAAEKIVAAAKKKVGKDAAAELGRVYQLAKSFSIQADIETLTAVAAAPGVKTILPSEIEDILPRPRNVGPV